MTTDANTGEKEYYRSSPGSWGRLTAGRIVACLNHAVDTLLARGLTNTVLNMELADSVDCAGIGQQKFPFQ